MDTKKERSQLPFRLNILFFIIFLLFAILVLQLGVVQILDGASYQEDIDRTVEDTTKIPVPRGKILDRNHQLLVDNKSLYSITYTPPKGVQAEDNLEVAKELVKYISVDEEAIDKITERNKQEYWYLLSEENQEEAYSRLTEEEIEELDNTEQYNEILKRITEEEISNFTEEKLKVIAIKRELDKAYAITPQVIKNEEEKEEIDNTEQYNEMLKRITEEEISNFTEEELKVIAIKRELDKAYALTPQVIKNEGVTPEEYARVSEHLHLLPGINATTDWDREYPYGEELSTFLGKITTQEQGIPKEKEDYYLSRGYSRNDRVGRSGLEDYYEDILRERKESIEYVIDKD